MIKNVDTKYNLSHVLLSEMEKPANLLGYNHPKFLGDKLRAQVALKNVRDRLVRAHKFSLSNDFLELAVEASLEPIERLRFLFERARPPFDEMFIEYDDIERIITVNRLSPKADINIENENPTRCGALIEKMNNDYSDTLFRITYFGGPTLVKDEKLKTVMFIISWYFDPINEIPDIYVAKGDYGIKADWNISGFPGMESRAVAGTLGLGPGYLEPWIGEWGVKNSTFEQIESVTYITKRINWAMNEFARWGVVKHIEELEKSGYVTKSGEKQTVSNFLLKTVKEQIGEVRIITAILGLINSGEYVSDFGQFESSLGQKKRVLGVTKKFIEFRTLSLKAPKQKKIILAKIKRQSMDLHKRAHEVMGHWCVRKDTGTRYWRKSHVRGDRSLGFIYKNYVVEKNPEGKMSYEGENVRVERSRNLYSRDGSEHHSGEPSASVAPEEGGVQSRRGDSTTDTS
jgi:hypothetical protein